MATSKLTGTVATAPAGQMGFDTDSVLTAQIAADFSDAGFVFCLRYLSRETPEPAADLTATEAAAILRAGLALMPVQHVAAAPWVPSAALGQQYGAAAVTNARAVGFPAGVNVWLDLEGVQPGTTADTVVAYCNAWFGQVAAAGYVPGVYVGYQAVLDSSELFWRLSCKSYWKSGSNVPDVDQRGYQMQQHSGTAADSIDGVGYDLDLTMTDNFGGAVSWLAPLNAASRKRTTTTRKRSSRAASGRFA